MPISAEALIQQILNPALPPGGPPIPAAPPRVRETASVLIGRIMNPSDITPGGRPNPDR